MTIKQAILNELWAEYPGAFTYAQIAHRIGAHEPSVRRASKQLQFAGRICFDRYADEHTRDMLWRAVR